MGLSGVPLTRSARPEQTRQRIRSRTDMLATDAGGLDASLY